MAADFKLIFLLRLADTSLVLGQRLCEWCGHAPTMEEDMALANIGLDLIGQARILYAYAGEQEGRGRDEDTLAFFRDAPGYHNMLMVELPNGDFAFSITRIFLFSAFMELKWSALKASSDEALAGLAEKSAKEVAYHFRHAAEWMVRLGDGTDESAARVEKALEDVWSFTGEMFEDDEIDDAAQSAGISRLNSDHYNEWLKKITPILQEATITLPADAFMQSGGRKGRHTEHLGYLLAEMQHLQRTYPGAEW